ncbi:FGGY family carbohydrate kinase [Helcobacillus massiliensis]|uniref:Xylulokinase n=1 Tax=Helcobacillus massiliensis TaxID=521392 RepID=A0A839QS91_9MICO|nr:FGGY family carbohydrate kinase [Helcobacillus massiliensis]MBB3022892.1 xylulokinase [Helcobacillus massiliensis]
MILAVDVGTTALKAALVDRGRVLAAASRAYPTHAPETGAAEQDPDDWCAALTAVVADLLAHPAWSDVEAIALTGQMQTLVLAEETDAGSGPAGADPARAGHRAPCTGRAVLYSDTRAAAEADEIRRAVPDWDEITGNLQGPTANPAQWLRLESTREPATDTGAVRRVFFSPAGLLAWMLGGDAHCDVTTASATGLLDARTRTWSEAIARAAHLPMGVLPAVGGGDIGTVTTEGESRFGVPAGLRIHLAPGDAAAATLGIVGGSDGPTEYISLGTSGWVASIQPLGAAPARPEAEHALLLDPPLDQHVLRIGALLSAGDTAAWARRTLLGGSSPQEADALLDARLDATGCTPSGLLALPSLRGERFPVRADRIGAAIIGMRPDTDQVTMYQAVLESVGLALANALPPSGAADEQSPEAALLPVVGGGAASRPWMRLIAAITGRDALPATAADAALLGAALAAGDARREDPVRDAAAGERADGASADVIPAPVGRDHRWDVLRARQLELFRAAAALSDEM